MMPRSLRTGSSFSVVPMMHAGQQVVVAAEVLGGRVQHVVDAGRDAAAGCRAWPAWRRSASRRRACWPISAKRSRSTTLRCGFVGDSLTSSLRLRRDRRFHRVVVAGLHLPRDHAEPRQVLGAELAAAVITLVEEDHLVAGVQLGHQQADDRRHAAGEEQGLFAPFERGQLPLDDLLAGVAVAAVLFARLLLLDEVDDRLRVGERVGRGAEDRVGDRVSRPFAAASPA